MKRDQARTYKRAIALASGLLLQFGMQPVLLVGPALAPALAKVSGKNTKDPADKNTKLGKKLYEKGDYDGALDALLQASYFARNGYNPEAFYYLGLTYFAKGQDQKAVDALTKHCEQSIEKTGRGHLALARCYTRMKNYRKAQEEIGLAFRDTEFMDPLTREIHLANGINEDSAGHLNAALSSYREALGQYQRDWDNYEAWIRYSECLMKMKEWVKAHTSLQDMVKTRNPLIGIKYERVYLDIGICLLTKGNHQGAIEAWHRALEYDPNNREVHLQLAMLFESERHLSSAMNEYKRFVACCGDEDKERVRQVEQRIATIEHKLASEAPPAPVQMQYNQETSRPQPAEEPPKNMPTDPGF